MVTDLKVTTRKGYSQVLDGVLLPRFKEKQINEVDGEAASKLDLELTKEKLAKSTRNNAQIVLRSVLRFAVEKKELGAMPSGLPRLKQPEPSILEIPSDDQVAEISSGSRVRRNGARSASWPTRGACGPSEVRALLRRDMTLRWEEERAPVGGSSASGRDSRLGKGTRRRRGGERIPVARGLAVLLGERWEKGPRDGHTWP